MRVFGSTAQSSLRQGLPSGGAGPQKPREREGLLLLRAIRGPEPLRSHESSALRVGEETEVANANEALGADAIGSGAGTLPAAASSVSVHGGEFVQQDESLRNDPEREGHYVAAPPSGQARTSLVSSGYWQY